MASKCLFLTKTSLLKKLKSKWFIVVNVLLLLAICVVVNIDHVISLFGGDFTSATPIYILDNTTYTYEPLKASIESTSNLANYGSYEVKKYEKSKQELKKEMADNQKIIGIVLKEDETNTLDVTVITNNYLETYDYQILSTAINQAKMTVAKALSNIDMEELEKISSPVEIKREYLNKDKKSDEESMSMIMTTIFPFVILPIFMLTVFLIQMIGAEINDEKSTRGMEIIISNVSPKAHFYSKILASNIFVIFQGVLLFIYGGIGFFIKNLLGSSNSNLTNTILTITSNVIGTDFMSKIISWLPILLILVVVTFLGYSLLAGILASITTSSEEFQQIQTPIMFLLLIGYYLAIMAGTFHGSIFIRVMSYLPFISAILAPSLLVLGQITVFDVIVGIIIQLIVNYIFIKYGLPVYKEGILNYSSGNLFKRFISVFKREKTS